tara:strand:+ start:2248 stop:2973 length:726 start_codon:yes stop_codon:yes gene_type:complete
MISKNQLSSVISKYYLNGLNNQVKWRIKDNTLTIYAGEAGRVCKVVANNFPLEDAELGVFDTNKLNKLLSITNGDLIITLEKMKAIYTKMHIQDSSYDLTYSLADTLILGKNTWYDDPDDWDVDINLEQEDVDSLIKAKNALSEVDTMLISTTTDFDSNKICEFLFGDNTGFSNKITYQIQGGTIKNSSLSIPFNSDIFKDILNNNKDQDKCNLKLSNTGILKIVFESENIKSEYFVARNE